MSIVGFNFTKISAERKNAVVGTININNNISLREVAEAKLGLAGDRGAVRISFLFTSQYVPDLALIQLEGDVLLLLDGKQQAEVLDSWQKNKQISRQLAEPVMNYILDRCNIQALLISKDLNLPSPVPLPKVTVNAPEKTEAPMKTTKVEKKDDKKKK